MRNINIPALALTGVLSLTLLAGCGAKGPGGVTPPGTSAPETTPPTVTAPVSPSPDGGEASPVQSVWAEIEQLDIPPSMDGDDAVLQELYGIDPADLEEYLCKTPMMSPTATEFFIARVKEGKMDAVKEGIAKRQAALVEQWSTYLASQLELVENYQLVVNGDYVLFAITEHGADAVAAFDTYTK